MERQSPIKHEFVDGYVYAMSGGTRRHSVICVNVTRLLSDHLRGTPCRVYNSDMKVQLPSGARDHVYPDASVSCDPRDIGDEEAESISYPRLVVEVLSDTTERYDRNLKFALYRGRETFEEYVLVETTRPAIEVRTCQEDGAWETLVYGPGQEVALKSLGLAVPVAEFYLNTTLADSART
jgi:Uma2 family endonuclease